MNIDDPMAAVGPFTSAAPCDRPGLLAGVGAAATGVVKAAAGAGFRTGSG